MAILHPEGTTPPEAERPPALVATEQLGKLAGSGASGERLAATAAEIVAGWQKAGASAESLREGITTILSDVDDGVVAAEQSVDDAEMDAQRAAALRLANALRALQSALAMMAERLG